MQKKYNRWLADWRDAQGVRHRKAFASKAEAFQKKQQQTTEALKNSHRSRRSRRSQRRGRKQTAKTSPPRKQLRR
jgi:hypothetical protein